MRETVVLKEVWVPSESKFQFTEQMEPHTGKRKIILKGLMLPFDTISRNNVLYNKDSIIQKHKDLIGRPMMYNHKVDDNSLPVGHFINSVCKEDGWYYEADIDPEEKHIIRKLERGDLRHVSIQLIGGRVVERQDSNGNTYTEAYISDIIEGSIVPAPGFLDTTAEFAEAFRKKEDATTSTGSGAIAPAKLSDKEKLGKEEPFVAKKFPMDEFQKGLAVETEHTDDPFDAARIAIDHLDEDPEYYTKLASVEKEAESYIAELGPEVVEEMIWNASL